MKHTKGKWTVTDKADTFSSTERDIIISDRLNGNGNRKVVARIHGLEDGVNNAELRKEAIANANLMASAPELLDGLIDMKNMISFGGWTPPSGDEEREDSKRIIKNVIDVIAKAEGK